MARIAGDVPALTKNYFFVFFTAFFAAFFAGFFAGMLPPLTFSLEG